ncbi:hypothetical protein CHCC20342_2601 [Bacillus licheniformis]|nr:hypothetical protein CHCC20342_2601 [Bacillus licheniformis]
MYASEGKREKKKGYASAYPCHLQKCDRMGTFLLVLMFFCHRSLVKK